MSLADRMSDALAAAVKSYGYSAPVIRSEVDLPALDKRAAGDVLALLRSLLLPPRTVLLQRVAAEVAALANWPSTVEGVGDSTSCGAPIDAPQAAVFDAPHALTGQPDPRVANIGICGLPQSSLQRRVAQG